MSSQCPEKPAERCLLVLCGLPASGKTTLARQLLVAASSPPWRDRLSIQVITFDDLLELDSLDFDPIHWKVRSHKIMRDRSPTPLCLWYACLLCMPLTRCHSLQASRQAAITEVAAALSAHRAARAALPLLVVADDNMQYRSMRYEVRCIRWQDLLPVHVCRGSTGAACLAERCAVAHLQDAV